MDRYDRNPGKDRVIANVRQQRMEAEHAAKNQFVKKVQNQQAMNQGVPPDLRPEAMEFNAYMCINGHYAQELAADVTKGMDKVAFPVREPGKLK